MKAVFEMMPVLFSYAPELKLDDFFLNGQAEKKIDFMNQIISIVKDTAQQDSTQRNSKPK